MFSLIREAALLVLFLFILSGCGTTKFNVIENSFGSKVAGYVVDVANEQPIGNVEMLLGNTTFSTETTPEGYFEFLDVPPGSYELFVRFDDGTLRSKRIRVRPDLENETDFLVSNPGSDDFEGLQTRTDTLNYLMKRVRELEEQLEQQEQEQLFASNGGGRSADSDYVLFKEAFVGPSENVTIRNPDVLRFEWDNSTLKVTADELLQIENLEMGYSIDLLIREFALRNTSVGYRMDYDIVPFFRELNTTFKDERERWKKNRREAFAGSFRHFLASLAAVSVEQEGFRLSSGYYRVQDSQIGSVYKGTESIAVNRSDIVTKLRDYAWMLELGGELSVVYEFGSANRKYNFAGVTRYAVQNSWLILQEESMVITAGGNVLDGSYEVAGYWKSTPVSEMLPAEYNPNNAES